MSDQNTNTVPEGYMQNAVGHLVHLDHVREQDKLRDGVVIDLATKALEINKLLKEFKEQCLSDVRDLIQISADKYEVTIGGKKGNISLLSFNGKYKIQRVYAERLTFSEEIEAAKQLIMNCIDRWSEGANNNMQELVNGAFKANNNGQLKTASVLGLLKLDVEDDEWNQAMLALKDSIQVSGTATYIRVYERIGQSEHYKIIPLDLAAV
ncbi:MAG: DUF3164 family protein [Oleispira sp.]|nr:DUF3164 family protein [Oleispira sp.]